MHRLLLLFMAVMTGVAATAADQMQLQGTPQGQADPDVRVIAGGPKTGEYLPIARRACDIVGKLFKCEAVKSLGASDNARRLGLPLDDPEAAHLAVLKGNVAADMQKEPDFGNKFESIQTLAPETMLAIMTPRTAGLVGSWAGVREVAFMVTIALPGKESGDAAVFEKLKAVPNSPLADARIEYFDRPGMVNAIVARKNDALIGFLTQFPNPDNELFSLIEEKGLVIMGVVDQDAPAASPLFQLIEKPVVVASANMWSLSAAKTVETVGVRTVLVARKPESFSDQRQQKIQRAMINKLKGAGVAQFLPPEKWMSGLIDAASAKVAGKADEIHRRVAASAAGVKERFATSSQ